VLTDEDLERALQRYQVVNPPGRLESAIVSATLNVAGRFGWLWGPAAAVVVVAIWIGIQLAMADAPADPLRDEEVTFVTQILGGGETAAAYADLVVPRREKPDPLRAGMEDRWPEN